MVIVTSQLRVVIVTSQLRKGKTKALRKYHHHVSCALRKLCGNTAITSHLRKGHRHVSIAEGSPSMQTQRKRHQPAQTRRKRHTPGRQPSARTRTLPEQSRSRDPGGWRGSSGIGGIGGGRGTDQPQPPPNEKWTFACTLHFSTFKHVQDGHKGHPEPQTLLAYGMGAAVHLRNKNKALS